MLMENDDGRRVVRGRVKWFDPKKGFGFIVGDDGGSDILLHANVLRNFGQNSVADGAVIECSIQSTDRGTQAVEVLQIMPPDSPPQTQLEDIDTADIDFSTLEFEPARVKWFDKSKGFGFANIFGNSDDIFVHVEVLRRSGFADLLPGEAICLKVVDGKRGRMAIQVAPWDIVNSD